MKNFPEKIPSLFSLVAFLILTLFVLGCGLIGFDEPPSEVNIKLYEEYPPTFELSGDGYVEYILVREVPISEGCKQPTYAPDTDIPLWRMHSIEYTQKPSEIGKVTYGHKIAGYEQDFPKRGKPPKLVEGKLYYFLAFGFMNSTAGYKLFIIRNGKVIEVQPNQCPPDVPNK